MADAIIIFLHKPARLHYVLNRVSVPVLELQVQKKEVFNQYTVGRYLYLRYETVGAVNR